MGNIHEHSGTRHTESMQNLNFHEAGKKTGRTQSLENFSVVLERFWIRSKEAVRLIPSQVHLEHQKEAC